MGISYGVASKFGYGSARGDPDVWNGLDHLRFGRGSGVWIGLWVQGMDRGYLKKPTKMELPTLDPDPFCMAGQKN